MVTGPRHWVQTITVTDNNTPYVVYGTQDAQFGGLNLINGSVGVTASMASLHLRPEQLSPHRIL